MAMTYNKVLYAGIVGSEIDLKYVGAKKSALATFSLAVNGARKEDPTLWLNCQVWGKQAEALVKYSGKGANLFVEGSTVRQEWTDKEGEKKTKDMINVREFKFLGDPPAKKGYDNLEDASVPF